MRLTKNFKLAWNIFFLVTALFFSGLAVMVLFFADTVDQMGKTRIENYFSENKRYAEQALLDLKNGNSTAVQNFLRGDLAEIKKGDRLYPVKRQLLLDLVSQLQSSNTDLTWVEWAKDWYKLDNRDVTAMAYYYLALMQSESEYEKGFKGLKNAHQRFPKHLLLKQFYHSAIMVD